MKEGAKEQYKSVSSINREIALKKSKKSTENSLAITPEKSS